MIPRFEKDYFPSMSSRLGDRLGERDSYAALASLFPYLLSLVALGYFRFPSR